MSQQIKKWAGTFEFKFRQNLSDRGTKCWSFLNSFFGVLYDIRNVRKGRELLEMSLHLEPVCCKKQQNKVPDQLLVYGIVDL